MRDLDTINLGDFGQIDFADDVSIAVGAIPEELANDACLNKRESMPFLVPVYQSPIKAQSDWSLKEPSATEDPLTDLSASIRVFGCDGLKLHGWSGWLV